MMAKRDSDTAGIGDAGDDGGGKYARYQAEQLSRKLLPTNETPPKASLLGISGELRNKIYHHALVEEEYMIEVHDEPKQPGLLRTCRQLRYEASGIFHEDNGFALVITNCDAPHRKHWAWPHICEVDINFAGDACWTNMLGYLKGVHAGRVPCMLHDASYAYMDGLCEDRMRAYEVCWEACQMVYSLMDVSWARVEGALGHFASAAINKKREWDWS